MLNKIFWENIIRIIKSYNPKSFVKIFVYKIKKFSVSDWSNSINIFVKNSNHNYGHWGEKYVVGRYEKRVVHMISLPE